MVGSSVPGEEGRQRAVRRRDLKRDYCSSIREPALLNCLTLLLVRRPTTISDRVERQGEDWTPELSFRRCRWSMPTWERHFERHDFESIAKRWKRLFSPPRRRCARADTREPGCEDWFSLNTFSFVLWSRHPLVRVRIITSSDLEAKQRVAKCGDTKWDSISVW